MEGDAAEEAPTMTISSSTSKTRELTDADIDALVAYMQSLK